MKRPTVRLPRRRTPLTDRNDLPPDFESAVAALRSRMPESDFAAAWAEGAALTLEEAVQEALEDDGGETET